MQVLQNNSKHILEVFVEYANLIISKQLSKHTAVHSEQEVQRASLLGLMAGRIKGHLETARRHSTTTMNSFKFAFQRRTPRMERIIECMKSYIKYSFNLSTQLREKYL